MPGYLTIPEFDAQNISVNPVGDLSANNIQSAFQELDSDLSGGLASKLDLAGGKILQIERATDSTRRSTTSSSAVDVTGMSVTITPQKSDSAIVIIANFSAEHDTTAGYAQFFITDSSNNSLTGTAANFGDGSDINIFAMQTLIAYSTPATTSAVTYKLRFGVHSVGRTLCRNDLVPGQMYALEVSA